MFDTLNAVRKRCRGGSAPEQAEVEEVDVCLIAEGCYPYISGGVSTWIDWLMRSHPDLSFCVLAILPSPPEGEPRYKTPENLRKIYQLRLDETSSGGRRNWPEIDPGEMAELMNRLLDIGGAEDFAELIDILGPADRRPSMDALLNSPQAWESMCEFYQSIPHTSFLDFFWAWRTLAGGLFRMLTFPLPKARLYHSVSTGYAGLISARAAIETGRSSIITEHGIYSNERRIEILMANWISNRVETGLDLSDDRKDIRELWARAFESFARIAYSSAKEITALYSANQVFQRALSAQSDKLRVIPNGVDMARFDQPRRARPRPTIAFIGRVTPIKDVQTFIDMAAGLRKQFPDIEALIIGPMDEDPEYAKGCVDEVARRKLGNTITFTGAVDVAEYLPQIDVLVLTSISEALPLVILEAGAAGVPCVATDVGACREILEQQYEGEDLLPGGIVAPVGASEELAEAVASLLREPAKCAAFGQQMKKRVATRYQSQTIADAYSQIYQRNLGAPRRAGA